MIREVALAAGLAVALTGAGLAEDLKAEQKLTDTQVGFALGGKYSNVTLSISGPNGISASAESRPKRRRSICASSAPMTTASTTTS